MRKAHTAFLWGLLTGCLLYGGESLVARFFPQGDRQAMEREILQTPLPQFSLNKKVRYWISVAKEAFPVTLVNQLKLSAKPQVPASFWAEFETAKKEELEKLILDYRNEYYFEWVGLPLHQLIRVRDHLKNEVARKVAVNRLKYQKVYEEMDLALVSAIKKIALEEAGKKTESR